MGRISTSVSSNTVLVVEDDPDLRELLNTELDSDGLTVLTARDGEEAIHTAQRILPDVILLDVMIPKVNGIEVTKLLNNDALTKHIPILILTVIDKKKDIIAGLDAGAIDYITKPFYPSELKARVNSVIRYKKLYDDLNDTKKKLIQSERKYRSLVENASDAIIVIQDKMVKFVNPNAVNLFCSPKEELIGKFLAELVHPDDRQMVLHSQAKVLESEKVCHVYSFRLFDKEHHIKWIETKSTPIAWEGRPATLSFLSDVTERKKAEEEIRNLAYYDSLTGLPNRLLFQDHLSRALASAERRGQMAAILFLDLDRFKNVNDTFGHTLGDMLLKGVAGRLEKALRKSDVISRDVNGELADNLARFGGDEFVILLTDIKNPQDAANVAERLIYTLSDTFVLIGHEIVITTSIGISLYPNDGEGMDVLVKAADKAMYYAKAQGRNNYKFYRDTLHAPFREKFPSKADLLRALEDEQLTLYYQPQVDVRTGRLTGTEALVRWRHPERGLVSPAEFIPVAEEKGLIVPFSEWVLRAACHQNMEWQKAGLRPVRVAVNSSGQVFKQKEFSEMISQILNGTGLLPQYLEIEVSESTMIQDEKEIFAALQILKATGIRLSIDDFGSGYSSLSYLRRFSLNAIKIHRSIVKDILEGADNKAFVTAIISMAHTLNLKVIAVGVETEEQLEFLRARGCDEMQGYYLSPPLPPDSITRLLQASAPFECITPGEACASTSSVR